MAADWPLVGREGELAYVARVLNRADSTGIVLVGPPGVGKTRLATECLRLGAESGFATQRVVASRAASAIPFGALAPLLPPGVVAMERGLNALRQATLALTERAEGKPLLLLVDDAHALDDASAVLLQQLAATRTGFLVVTLRSGEVPPEPVTALWKDHGVERLTIEPLDRDDADQLVATMLGGDLDQTIRSMLWDKTRGNPLFIRELVLGAVESGALSNRMGRWQADGELEPSDRLSELVASRLGGLERPELDALELVAFGEPLGVGLLSDLTDPTVVEELERKGLVALIRDGRRNEIRLAHPMYGEVLRARTPALRARSISRSLASALEATGANRRGDALRVSLWRLDGGGLPPMALLLEASAQARFANNYEIAHRLARIAFEVEPTFDSGMLLLDVLYSSDRARESDPISQAIAPLATTDQQFTMFTLLRAATLFWKQGDADGARRVLHEAMDRVQSKDEQDELAAFLAEMDLQAGHSREAYERMAPIIAHESGRPFVLAAVSAALASAILGRCADAVDIADRAFAVRVEMGHELTLYQSGILLVHKAVAVNEAGRPQEAYELANFTRLMAADSNDLSGQAFCCIALVRVCMLTGKTHEAMRWSAEAAELLRRKNHPGPLRWSLSYLALAAAMSGDGRTAGDALAELEIAMMHPAAMLEVETMRAKAWKAICDARPEDAKAILVAAAKEMNASGQVSFEAAVLFDLARLGEAEEVADRLVEIGEHGQSELHRTMGAAARAMAQGRAGDIAAQSDAFAAMGVMLYAAEWAVAASDAFRKEGDQRRVAEWSRRASELTALCDGAQTPGLVQIDAPVPLTQREREIALLATQGLTSKIIGERLFVASRTVDNHLARIYSKLGVSNRNELSAALSGFEDR